MHVTYDNELRSNKLFSVENVRYLLIKPRIHKSEVELKFAYNWSNLLSTLIHKLYDSGVQHGNDYSLIWPVGGSEFVSIPTKMSSYF